MLSYTEYTETRKQYGTAKNQSCKIKQALAGKPMEETSFGKMKNTKVYAGAITRGKGFALFCDTTVTATARAVGRSIGHVG